MKTFNFKVKTELVFVWFIALGFLLSGCSQMADHQAESVNAEFGSSEAEPAGEKSAFDVQDESAAEDRKLIKTGELEIRSDDVQQSYQFVLEIAQKYEGYETDIYQDENQQFLSITTTLAIPAEHLDDYIAKLGESENVKYININTQDITNAYFDSQTRLQTLKKSLNKYYELLEQAESTEDLILIQEKIDEITTNIELIKGESDLWDKQIAYSRLTISIFQKEDIINTNQKIDFSALTWAEISYFLRTGWTKLLNIIVAAFQWLFIVLLIVAPIAVPILLVVFLILHFHKKKKAKKEKPIFEKQNSEHRLDEPVQGNGAADTQKKDNR